MSPPTTPSAVPQFAGKAWDLPPLILHPFNEHVPPSTLLDNSKAALTLSGLIPSDGTDPAELTRRLLAGRYSEIRMLFFLGKDVFRWIDQCLECAARIPELNSGDTYPQSFAALLTKNTPVAVADKLVQWGVADYVSIFSRAIGLNAQFSAPPSFESLAPGFLRSYHRYADVLFRCFMDSQAHRVLDSANFRFQLYASGEYSRMLESEWGTAEN